MNSPILHALCAQLDNDGYVVLLPEVALRWQAAMAPMEEAVIVTSSLGPGEFQPLQRAGGPGLFPFQLITLLSAPGVDFTGGECVMTEQRPRRQSRPLVVPLRKGEVLIVGAGKRPVSLRHAVSTVRSGRRDSTLLSWKIP